MYSEWVSLTDCAPTAENLNVLQTFPVSVGREVVQSVLRPLAELGNSRLEVNSSLTTAEQIQWTMQVVGYGLTLPLSHQALIEKCIDVYDDWLSALYSPRKSVPRPVQQDPDHYAQIIFKQFYQLFVPRKKLTEGVFIENHIFLCKRVLQSTHSIVMRPDARLSRDTWTALFTSLLKSGDVILSPPHSPGCLGGLLCESLIHVLFEAWLKSCVDCFPPPNLWKSLREACSSWRHHRSVIERWNKLMYSLTYHVISHLYSPKYLSNHSAGLPEEDVNFRRIVTELPKDALVQCWFRMLHTLDNPVEIAYPNWIANQPAFQKVISTQADHSCLSELSQIFLEAMRGVAALVYLFLRCGLPGEEKQLSEGSYPSTPTPAHPSPHVRQKDSRGTPLAATGGGVSGAKLKPTAKWHVPLLQSPGMAGHTSHSPAPEGHSPLLHRVGIMGARAGEDGRPRGNTLLHLFGGWLFEAAVWPLHAKGVEPSRSSRSSLAAVVTNLIEFTPSLTPTPTILGQPSDYEAGRAEAFGALCSLFSHQPCGEPFLPIYLARFYHSLAVGLTYHEELCQGQMLTQILLNSTNLLRKDLRGINILLPKFLSALELILPQSEVQFKCAVDLRELRHASILILLSMLALPLHFLYQPLPGELAPPLHFLYHPLPDLQSVIPDLNPSAEVPATPPMFYSLRGRMLRLLFEAIKHETDPVNMQMLLHGLLTMIQDIVTYDNAVAKMVEEETAAPEDVEVSAILSQHPPLGPVRSNASSQSRKDHTSFLSSLDKCDTDLTPLVFFKRAVEAAYGCLSTWESSIQVSLAALELLAGLAQLQIEDINHADCKQAVHWVCEYIEHQALKDNPQHSRDLHTCIVAAFETLLTWIMAHPYLLGNMNCLTAIMQVTELGISGSFSMMEDGSVIYKGDKALKPISGRVKDIAEFTLACIMEEINFFPSPCGAEASSSLLSEEDLLARLPQGRKKEDVRFRYFVLDNSLLLGLLEEPFSEEGDAPPTVTAVIRSPTGRHVWSLQLRHQPRSEEPSTQHLHSALRPSPNPHTSIPPSLERKPWPDQVNNEPKMNVDESIPSLSETLDDDTRSSHSRVEELTAQQMAAERKVHQEIHESLSRLEFPDPNISLEPPEVKKSFETARLLLSHLGVLGIDSVRHHPSSQLSSLAMLDSSTSHFHSSLLSLDRLPARFCNTVFVLHCREGMTKPEDILAHQQSLSNKSSEFAEFLQGLGWIVEPVNHPGFAGKIRPSKSEDASRLVGISAQIPLRAFPYYADVMNEVAFIVPTLKPSSSDSATSLRSAESSDSGQDVTASLAAQTQGQTQQQALGDSHGTFMQPLKERQGSGVSESTATAQIDSTGEKPIPAGVAAGIHPLRTKFSGSKSELIASDTPRRRLAMPQDCAAMVVWLEKFEDHTSFPLEVLSGTLHGGTFVGFGSHKSSKKVLPTIFIHLLSSGLYQITIKNPSGRQDLLAGPLIDGMVVSRRTLSALVRKTTINMCSRHRMENEGYAPPHAKRKRKLEEIATAFAKRSSVADFYARLFVE